MTDYERGVADERARWQEEMRRQAELACFESIGTFAWNMGYWNPDATYTDGLPSSHEAE